MILLEIFTCDEQELVVLVRLVILDRVEDGEESVAAEGYQDIVQQRLGEECCKSFPTKCTCGHRELIGWV